MNDLWNVVAFAHEIKFIMKRSSVRFLVMSRSSLFAEVH